MNAILRPFRALVFTLSFTAAVRALPATNWVDVSPKDGGFSVQMPATPKPSANRPGRLDVTMGDSSFIVSPDPIDPAIGKAVRNRNRGAVDAYLGKLRDGTVNGMEAKLLTSEGADLEGSPSILFTFTGESEGKAFEGTERIVLTADRMFVLVALGEKGSLKKEDVDRFLGSFRLVAAPPGAPGEFRTVAYRDAVCQRMPAVPVTFSLPADYVSRSVGKSVEAGCLWGTKEDLDRVTAVPDEGDFSALKRGVFRARVSTNIVCSAKTGTFDAMDGSGEAGIRAQLEASGASLVTWKKETLGGLPALQIVADLGPSGRVYMLYLGNTGFSSNTLLVNYYQPKKRTADDDALWARFVSGIRRAASP